MTKKVSSTCEKAMELTKEYFKAYFEERDFSKITPLFDENISWFGTGAHEVCRNLTDAMNLMRNEENAWDGRFKILDQWYDSVDISDKFCIVYGEIKVIEDGLNTILLEMTTRFSIICALRDNGIKLIHVHFSVPNEGQGQDEYAQKTYVKDYNVLLEEKLIERTKLLKEKTSEMEAIANNVFGGVQICKVDDDFTIVYKSDGFLNLTGYTAQELEEKLDNKHALLVYPKDLDKVLSDIKKALEVSDNFIVEYRMVKKSGEVIWVIDKGIMFYDSKREQRVQSILTDITERKKMEDELILSQKRYELAIKLSDITMFEYNVLTKELIVFDRDVKTFGMPFVSTGGADNFIKNRIVEEKDEDSYREMFRQIHAGEKFAECFVTSRDVSGELHDLHLSLTNIFDENDAPVRAIGVRKNMTELRQLQKENEFGKTLVLDKQFVCEANITDDSILQVNAEIFALYKIPEVKTFSEFVEILSTKIFVHDEDIRIKLSIENITKTYESGERILVFSYKIKLTNGLSRWHEASLNIIREKSSLIVRYYFEDINEERIAQQRVIEERHLYEKLVSKAFIIYEVNISKNTLISGMEETTSVFFPVKNKGISSVVKEMGAKAVYKDDINIFYNFFDIDNVTKEYDKGKTLLVSEYRRKNGKGVYIWARASIHLSKDAQTGDIKSHIFIEDIDKEKHRELELIFKSEHDMLTGLLNKSSTEKYISDYLMTKEGKHGNHAFFIIDIDYFKDINDNFGHSFGDVVLSKIGSKIKEMFTADDIMGRIGGDEFVVFMKNISNNDVAIEKAKKVCDKIGDTYTIRKSTCKIATSIGLAIYNKSGENYETLYKNSDTALYESKENGRNRFTLYKSDMAGLRQDVSEIESRNLTESKTFEQNVMEYVFKILYESKDRLAAISSVLELLGKHYEVSRVYIFERISETEFSKVTFSWASNDEYKIPLRTMENKFVIDSEYYKNFDSSGMAFRADIRKAEDSFRQVYENIQVKSFLQFSIVSRGEIKGFIGLDQCDLIRVPSRKEVSELRNLSNILGLFVSEFRMIEEANNTKSISLSIINGLTSYAYICEPTSYKILFANSRVKDALPHVEDGDLCYKVLCGKDAPCEDCPMKKMLLSNTDTCSVHMHNPLINSKVKVSSSWVEWRGNSKKCLIECMDISKLLKEL